MARIRMIMLLVVLVILPRYYSWGACGGSVIESPRCTGDSMLCMKKGVSLKGAGSSSTIITLSGTAVYGAICYEPDETSISNNNTFEITGFSFDSGGANYAEGMIDVRVRGNTAITNIKIYNNIFKSDGGNGTAIMLSGPIRGVVYSNTFTDIGYYIRVVGDNATSWALNQREYGTVNNVFFEDNTANFTVGTSSADSGYMVGHALVAFIEIKYQAKINASMDY